MDSKERPQSFDDDNSICEASSEQPLLESEEQQCPRALLNHTSRIASRYVYSMVILLLLNVTLLGINYALFMKSGSNLPQLRKSPASEAATFIPKTEHATSHSQHSPYSGHPSDANIKAWEDLIEPTFFGATKEELEDAGEDAENAVELAEGGNIAAIGVYHEIHCLRQLRLFLYSDVFYPNLTDANIRYLQGHLDHCLETIRISLMCSADLSLYTFEWDAKDMTRPKPCSNSSRMCMDWSRIESWASERMVPIDPLLKIPTRGVGKIHM